MQVADTSHSAADQQLLSGPLSARVDVARRAKHVVELDRAHAAAEEGYVTAVLEVMGARDMAKAELLVGVPQCNADWTAALCCVVGASAHALVWPAHEVLQ